MLFVKAEWISRTSRNRSVVDDWPNFKACLYEPLECLEVLQGPKMAPYTNNSEKFSLADPTQLISCGGLPKPLDAILDIDGLDLTSFEKIIFLFYP